MASYHQLLMPGKIFYGPGSIEEVGKSAAALGRKALIISDQIMNRIGNVALCEDLLIASNVLTAKYLEVNTEPTDKHVEEALQVCRDEKCDLIVAIGGGSCIDTAKAVAVMMTNEGYIGDYIHQDFALKPLPLIAIPTTAGTGSEVTKVTVIINTVTDVKMMISKPELLPSVSIVDPKLTLSCPPSVTAATGIDALCHAIEAYLSRCAHFMTDNLALTAIELIVPNLQNAYHNGDDLESRNLVALGSMLAGAAFSNASVTLVHGMSRPIGALFHVPHGISNAMLLPAVLEFTKESALERLARISKILNPGLDAHSDEQLADAAVQEIKKLCASLQIPNLMKWGIGREQFEEAIPKMCRDALASGSPGNNPRVPDAEEIANLYRVCYDYEFGVEA